MSIGALIVDKVACLRYEYGSQVDYLMPATSKDIHRTNADRGRSSGLKAGTKQRPSQVSPETVSLVLMRLRPYQDL